MACLQNYRELLSLATFLRVHSNSKEVSYLSWQNTYPNLKTSCHVNLNFFLWTKLLENLLHAKYIISVATPLIGKVKMLLHSDLQTIFLIKLKIETFFEEFDCYCYNQSQVSMIWAIHHVDEYWDARNHQKK